MGRTGGAGDFFLDLYNRNLTAVWDSLLPAPDICVIQRNGEIKKVDQTLVSIAKHYFCNIVQCGVAVACIPFTFTLSAISSLCGRVKNLTERVEHPEFFQHPAQVQGVHIPDAFGFSSSRFQDSAEGTFLDLSELAGIGTGDWDKVFRRPVQRVTQDGKKVGPITHGITLQQGEELQDLFVNVIDHAEKFAELLQHLGCTAYRTSLERSVMEPKPGQFSEQAIDKYKAFYAALKAKGIEPWITLHHFTNPQWFEEAGGFANAKNIEGFVRYAEKMVEQFPEVTNWMTFNEPGVRGMEGYLRGEHPPEHKNVSEAALVIRNILIAHHKTYAAIKQRYPHLNVGLTHQWLRFLPLGHNPIEKITAYFFTHFVHTPVFGFLKEGKLHIRVPFRVNIQLIYEDEKRAKTTRIADFLGIQAYGYTRVKIGFNRGKPYPGAADKVNNFLFPSLPIGLTFGATCKKGDRVQYFGPSATTNDLIHVLDEAFTIPHARIPKIGISETGRDAMGMRHGDPGVLSDDAFQAEGVHESLRIAEKYPLSFYFWWTLKRHCEWKSGGVPRLGLSNLKYDRRVEKFMFEETAGIRAIREEFMRMQAAQLERQRRVA